MKKEAWLVSALLTGMFSLCAASEKTYFYTYEKEIEGLNAPVTIEIQSVRPLQADEIESGWQRLEPVLIKDLTASGQR